MSGDGQLRHTMPRIGNLARDVGDERHPDSVLALDCILSSAQRIQKIVCACALRNERTTDERFRILHVERRLLRAETPQKRLVVFGPAEKFGGSDVDLDEM